MKDADIDFGEIPELDEEFWRGARLVLPPDSQDLAAPSVQSPEGSQGMALERDEESLRHVVGGRWRDADSNGVDQ